MSVLLPLVLLLQLLSRSSPPIQLSCCQQPAGPRWWVCAAKRPGWGPSLRPSCWCWVHSSALLAATARWAGAWQPPVCQLYL